MWLTTAFEPFLRCATKIESFSAELSGGGRRLLWALESSNALASLRLMADRSTRSSRRLRVPGGFCPVGACPASEVNPYQERSCVLFHGGRRRLDNPSTPPAVWALIWNAAQDLCSSGFTWCLGTDVLGMAAAHWDGARGCWRFAPGIRHLGSVGRRCFDPYLERAVVSRPGSIIGCRVGASPSRGCGGRTQRRGC